jgi:hypothetical protein
MASNQPGQHIRPKTRRKLDDLYSKITRFVSAARVWEDLLNEEEQERLGGDLEACCRREGGIVGAWMELKKVSSPRAILEIARGLGLLIEDEFERMMDELGEERKKRRSSKLPVWDREERELRFEGSVIRRIRSLKVAKNIVLILDRFQECEWQPRIENPLDATLSPQPLHDAVHSLNSGLKKIRFRVEGDGTKIAWSRHR